MGEKKLAMESVNSLRISAPQWRPLREGRDGKCEERNEKCEFLARESVSSSPTVRIFGKGKCKFIANFSATMVTSLPSLSLCLSVSLSLSLSHRKYLTHNIGSASALPIIGSASALPVMQYTVAEHSQWFCRNVSIFLCLLRGGLREEDCLEVKARCHVQIGEACELSTLKLAFVFGCLSVLF